MGDAMTLQLGQRLSHETAPRVVIGHRIEGRQGEDVQLWLGSKFGLGKNSGIRDHRAG
jgi:hypothetical protein